MYHLCNLDTVFPTVTLVHTVNDSPVTVNDLPVTVNDLPVTVNDLPVTVNDLPVSECLTCHSI